MQNNHASAIKGVNIAVIVFAAIAILACFVGFALAGIGGSAINQYGYHLFDEALTSHHELERELAASGITVTGDITGTDVVNSLNFALALGMFGIGWELISAVVTLVAGIMGVRGASRREKLGGVLVWSIVGAVVALLGGRIITCILLIISAVLAGMDKRAYAIPYGQPTAQPYGQPAAQPYGQPTAQPFPQTPQASPYASTYGAAGQSPAQAGPAAADEDPANANRPNA